ncbi:MAG TPA: spore coat U domain-containing protein [Steroidobacteraceae bacterium]|nr:spore coat U domain-containing protein [Steroidobacteraceae bacterium]
MSRSPGRLPGARCLYACLLLTALGALASPAARAQAFFCSAGATGVAFGTYTPLTPVPLASTGTITVQCLVFFAQATVTVDLSSGASGNFVTRSLTSGTNTLSYNLYLNAAHTQVWGDGSGGSLIDTLTLNPGFPSTVTATIYGAVNSLQDPAPGSYSDTITVTVNY